MNNQRLIINLFPTGIGLLYLVFIAPSYCDNCKGDKFDWKKRADMNLDRDRYPGEWYVIDCQLQDNLTNGNVSLWQRNGKTTKQIHPDQYKVTESNQIFNITNLTFSYDGNYYCRACKRKEISFGYLTIKSDGKAYQTPKILNKSAENVTVTYGSNLIMECEVTGYYAMNWYIHGDVEKLHIAKDMNYKTGSGFHIEKKRLTIERFTDDDDGLYMCKVQRFNWRATDSVTLKAGEVKPTIQKEKLQYVVNNKEFIILRCHVTNAYPPAEFEWYECIHAFYNCSNEKVGWFKRNGSSSENRSSLNITNQLKFYKVSYRCTAKNMMGNDTYMQETLNKNGIMSMEALVTKTPQCEIAGVNITMVCESNDSVIMKWMKNTTALQSTNASYKQHGFIVTKQILEIINFSKQDEGMYRCQVTVKEFKWSDIKIMNVVMRVKPKITKGNGLIIFKEGIQLKCKLSAKAVPQANISWAWCICDDNCFKCNTTTSEQRLWFDESQNQISMSEELSTLTIKQQPSERKMHRCRAKNECAGKPFARDERKWIVYKVKDDPEKDNNVYLVIIYCTVALIFIFLLIIAMVLYWRKKLYGGFYIFTVPPLVDYIGKLDEEKSLIEQFNKLPYISEWEFPRERVQLEKIVGKGAFGRVYLSKVIGISAFNPRKVLESKSKQNRFSLFRNRKRNSYLYCTMTSQAAVKMLNDHWNESELSDLQTELKLLIHVGQHNNIVNILGACTKGPRGKAWIIMEYCEHGNLSQFLQDRRTIFETEWLEFSEDQNTSLSNSDLAGIALQVVFGMKFLVSRKCIHRDLAARNVLISDGFVPKIADFGLARDVYKDEQYIKKNAGLLPIKWMSIEAIRDMTFSEKSDIWSFGILLWEIFSMGGSPYLGIPASEIYEYLCQGNRMKPPAVCPSEIYDLMLECWSTEREERPDFKTVEELLTKILMIKNRPWIFPLSPFEQEETINSPEYNRHMEYKFKKSGHQKC